MSGFHSQEETETYFSEWHKPERTRKLGIYQVSGFIYLLDTSNLPLSAKWGEIFHTGCWEEKVSVVQQQWSWLLDTVTVGHDITHQNSDKLGIFRRSLMNCKLGKYSIDFLVNFVLFLWIWHLGQEPASEQHQSISGKHFLDFKGVWKSRSRQSLSLESKTLC